MSELDVDDIVGELNKREGRKKRINSGRKGKRGERGVCKVLNARFAKTLAENPKWGLFSRSVGSGNRWGQNVKLSEAANQTFSGDVACPSNFIWTIESKDGYEDTDLCSAFDGGHRQIDEFIEQVSADADRTGRKPLIVWKKNYKPRLAILRTSDMPCDYIYQMQYRDWTICFLDDLLTQPDTFFFKLAEST